MSSSWKQFHLPDCPYKQFSPVGCRGCNCPKPPACSNPRCVELWKKYPPGNHIAVGQVIAESWKEIPCSTARCYSCGGYYVDGKWVYKCLTCKKDMPPDSLHGMWVRHSCKECEDKRIADEKAQGWICKTCGNVHSYCYC